MNASLFRILLPISTGLLLAACWPSAGEPALVFIAFVPLLIYFKHAAQSQSRYGWRMYGSAWAAMAVWNALTTYWVGYAHWIGAVASTTINATVQAMAWYLAYRLAKPLGYRKAFIALPFFWFGAEWLMENWELDWPWLALGNTFAGRPSWVQWYSYTGSYGGTYWVMLINGVAFSSMGSFLKHKQWKPLVGQLVLIALVGVVLPVLFSIHYFQKDYHNTSSPIHVAVVQPNLDPYTEKFSMPQWQQNSEFMRLVRPLVSDTLSYVVGPETFLNETLQEELLPIDGTTRPFKEMVEQNPNLAVVFGATTARIYGQGQQTKTARPGKGGEFYYDVFNAAVQIDGSDSVSVYHKSKLVTGVEKMPFHSVISPLLGSVILDLGGTTGTMGKQENTEVFVHPRLGTKVGVAICYESVFPEFFASYVSNGAEVMFIITNDGWWSNSDGHRQHMLYAQLRAIETGRYIVRSANTGISAAIKPNGEVISSLPYGTEGAFLATVYPQNTTTFFVKHGNVLGRVSLFMAVGFLLYGMSQGLRQKQ